MHRSQTDHGATVALRKDSLDLAGTDTDTNDAMAINKIKLPRIIPSIPSGLQTHMPNQMLPPPSAFLLTQAWLPVPVLPDCQAIGP